MTTVFLYSDSCFYLDGLVKRLEELERTAELYKGKLDIPSDIGWEKTMPSLSSSEVTYMFFLASITGLTEHTKSLLRAFFELSQTHRGKES